MSEPSATMLASAGLYFAPVVPTLHRFRAHFGVSPDEAGILWETLSRHGTDHTVKARHLLYALHFLFRYETDIISATFFHVDAKTWSKWLWRTLEKMQDRFNFVRNLTSFSVSSPLSPDILC
jgi:hypothetical protein